VQDRWGVFHAQPIVLNERQAGAAIEGVIRQERIETSQFAVDTHGFTDFAMGLSRLLGSDLCPRLRELKQRHLFVPRGMKVPQAIAAVCQATWTPRHASAMTALARFGSAARGDPIYDAGVQLGKLLRTVFLADYFVNDGFRRELHRVLNRGGAVNALKRAIYTGRVTPAQARRNDEMQAVADALSLLANIVMAWNTAQMQAVLDRWANRRQIVPPELIGRIAPTRLEGNNLRGPCRFEVELGARYLLNGRFPRPGPPSDPQCWWRQRCRICPHCKSAARSTEQKERSSTRLRGREDFRLRKILKALRTIRCVSSTPGAWPLAS